MNHILVKSGIATLRQMKRKDGTLINFNEQHAAVVIAGEDFPRPFKINLDEGQPAYPAGTYAVDASSFEVGDYDALKLSRRVKLVPITLPKP